MTERVDFDVSQHYSVMQSVVSQKVVLRDGSVRLYPIEIRYAWPSELDLMAQLAGPAPAAALEQLATRAIYVAKYEAHIGLRTGH